MSACSGRAGVRKISSAKSLVVKSEGKTKSQNLKK